MTVKELIEQLQQYPEDLNVEIIAGYDGGPISYIEKRTYDSRFRTKDGDYINIVSE